MTERYGSTRKHKKHKASHKNAESTAANNITSSQESSQEPPAVASTASNGNATTAINNNEVRDSAGSSTPSRQQPIRMVLKLAQSGAYSPASTAQVSDSGGAEGSNNNPPQLLPLNSDSYQPEFYGNGSMKRAKKKKKKHHHHHHSHHHHSSSHTHRASSISSSNVNSDASVSGTTNSALAANFFDGNSNLSEGFSGTANPNATLNTLARGADDLDDEDDAVGADVNDDELGNGHHKAPNKNILNLIDSELMLDASPHDSIASVDLMDVDSSNLDLSCLQPTGDSPQDGDSTPGMRTRKAKGRDVRLRMAKTNQSPYRRLLQRGQVLCDSNNVLQLSRTIGSRPTTKKAKAFQKFATELLDRLKEKDSFRFFAWPVTELLAPGYSLVVSNPMDFSTIEKKIQFSMYRSIYEMKYDVRILCENALKYYRQSGAQYREAAKLWYYAKTKIFNRENYAEVLKKCPLLTLKDLGLEQAAHESKPHLNGFSGLKSLINNEETKPAIDQFDAKVKEEEVDDNASDEEEGLSQEELFREAQKSLGPGVDVELAELESKWALSKVDTLARQRRDGSTSLGFACPFTEVDPDGPTTLGAYVGRLQEGSRSLPITKEPEMYRVKVMQLAPHTMESSFCSHLPMFDTGPSGSSGVLNLEETSLLLSSFGERESNFSDAIHRISNDADYMIGFVDSVLDIVTGGQYSKEKPPLEEVMEEDELMETGAEVNEVELLEEVSKPAIETTDSENSIPKGPNDDEADSTQEAANGLPVTEEEEEEENFSTNDELQLKLNETQSLIEQLETVQHKRLCSGPELTRPDDKEIELAEKVTSKLVEMIGSVARPCDVVSVDAVRSSMGVIIEEEKDDGDDQVICEEPVIL